MWIELEGRSELVPALISGVIEKVLIGGQRWKFQGLQANPLKQY
jgi:hypothetical protein